jgi:hypothetical protein
MTHDASKWHLRYVNDSSWHYQSINANFLNSAKANASSNVVDPDSLNPNLEFKEIQIRI